MHKHCMWLCYNVTGRCPFRWSKFVTDTVKETVQRTVGSPQPQVPLSGTVDLVVACTRLAAYISFTHNLCKGVKLKSMGYQTYGEC